MADGKQRQNAAKVATPKIAAGGAASAGGNKTQQMDELDVALSKAIGARVKVTTAQTSFEGVLFTSDPITNLIALNTAPAPPNPSSSAVAQAGDYHIIPISHISGFQVLAPPTAADKADGAGLVGFDGALPTISKLDLNALKQREEAAIRKTKERDANRPKGVSKDGHGVFETLRRTLPAYWTDDQSIIVNDNVRINKPYGVNDCQAAAKDTVALQRIKMQVEAYWNRQKGKPQQSSSAGSRNSVATPLPPRKGG